MSVLYAAADGLASAIVSDLFIIHIIDHIIYSLLYVRVYCDILPTLLTIILAVNKNSQSIWHFSQSLIENLVMQPQITFC